MPSYSEHWAHFRRWNRRGIAVLVLSIGFLLCGLPLIESRVSWAAFPLVRHGSLIVCWLWFFYFVVRQQDFDCPRCGNHFFWRGSMPYAVAFRRRCAHCALELYADGPNKSQERTREK
jgi:hypothetical protein